MATMIERICSLLKERDIRDKDFCTAIGVSQSTFSTWKSLGRDPKAKLIPVIADVLGVSQQYLTTGENGQYLPDPFSQLDGVYLSLAKEARDNNIDPDDIRLAINMIRKIREEEKAAKQ